MFDRIGSNPTVLGGKPIIKGTRISVEMILEWIASGGTRDEILAAHPHLTAADIEQALSWADQAEDNNTRDRHVHGVCCADAVCHHHHRSLIMRLLDLRFTLPVNYARCLVGTFAISLALGGSPLTAAELAPGESSRGGDVVVIPWSAKDRTFLWAGPVNTFGSGIFLLDGNCEILLDDKKVSTSDLKLPMVGDLTFSGSRSMIIPVANRMKLRSIRFDPLTKDEHRTSLPSVSKGIKPNESDIQITDYINMGKPPGPWPRKDNWHAQPQNGILKGATDTRIVIAPFNALAGRGIHDPKPKPFNVPVTRIVNMVSSEYIRHDVGTGSGDVRGVGISGGIGPYETSHPTETYYYNPLTRVLESSIHRDAYFLGAAPDKDVEACKQICEHYKKDWATISGAERVWTFRLVHYERAQQAQFAEDIRDVKRFAALGTIVWLASIAPSIPSVVLPTTRADTKINVTVLRTVVPPDAKLYWTQYELSDAVNATPWSTAAKGADENYSFKCNPNQPLWVKVNEGKPTRIHLSDRDHVVERIP
ncbi:MAG: DUF433 domain-containing protein [Planctomycetia bacterium]|nr:DUF433 domain-containing protein [Planctomycetia bacterium]